MSALFWSLSVLLGYTFIGYPLLLLISGILSKSAGAGSDSNTPDSLPSATIIIPAYNEEADIRSKLENVLQLNYPKLEIIVASDESTDKTDDIVREFAGKGVKLCRLEKRGGKIAAYKNSLRQATGEILIFSDATSMLEKDSLRFMLRNFSNPKVGCVAGRLFFIAQDESGVGKGEATYWRYNILINNAEARLASLTSVSGTFFAVRKDLFPPDIPSDLAEDLIVPLNVVRQGYKTILEPRAACREASVHVETQEIRKRARITLQNIRGLVYGWDLLNVFKYGLFSVLLFSHKVLRILAPILLGTIFVLNVFLLHSSEIFKFLLEGQIAFYLVGFLSGLWRHRPKLLNVIHFFCLSNYAVFLGILMFFRGNRMATWNTERV